MSEFRDMLSDPDWKKFLAGRVMYIGGIDCGLGLERSIREFEDQARDLWRSVP